MSDIVVTRWRAGWTVRHPCILFERFAERELADRRAAELLRLFGRRGETVRIVRRPDARR